MTFSDELEKKIKELKINRFRDCRSEYQISSDVKISRQTAEDLTGIKFDSENCEDEEFFLSFSVDYGYGTDDSGYPTACVFHQWKDEKSEGEIRNEIAKAELAMEKQKLSKLKAKEKAAKLNQIKERKELEKLEALAKKLGKKIV